MERICYSSAQGASLNLPCLGDGLCANLGILVEDLFMVGHDVTEGHPLVHELLDLKTRLADDALALLDFL